MLSTRSRTHSLRPMSNQADVDVDVSIKLQRDAKILDAGICGLAFVLWASVHLANSCSTNFATLRLRVSTLPDVQFVSNVLTITSATSRFSSNFHIVARGLSPTSYLSPRATSRFPPLPSCRPRRHLGFPDPRLVAVSDISPSFPRLVALLARHPSVSATGYIHLVAPRRPPH